MTWLGVLFALLVGYALSGAAPPAARRGLQLCGWAIWLVFVGDFVLKLYVAPSRPRFIRRHWLEALMLAIPTLRVLRFARLLRIGRAFPAARARTSGRRRAVTRASRGGTPT